MSRSNPYKPKPRAAKSTVLAVGEGQTEFAFLRHLKHSFLEAHYSLSIHIRCAGGRSPKAVVKQAIKHNPRNYTSAFVLMDTDTVWPVGLESHAKRNGFTLIGLTPCIEAFLLSLLEPSSSFRSWKTDHCKRVFHEKYLARTEKVDYREYAKVFPADILQSARLVNSQLEDIIRQLFLGKV